MSRERELERYKDQLVRDIKEAEKSGITDVLIKLNIELLEVNSKLGKVDPVVKKKVRLYQYRLQLETDLQQLSNSGNAEMIGRLIDEINVVDRALRRLDNNFTGQSRSTRTASNGRAVLQDAIKQNALEQRKAEAIGSQQAVTALKQEGRALARKQQQVEAISRYKRDQQKQQIRDKAQPPAYKLGDRDPQTGSYIATAPNGGTRKATPLFNSGQSQGGTLKTSYGAGGRILLDAKNKRPQRRPLLLEEEQPNNLASLKWFTLAVSSSLELLAYVGNGEGRQENVFSINWDTPTGTSEREIISSLQRVCEGLSFENIGLEFEDWLVSYRDPTRNVLITRDGYGNYAEIPELIPTGILSLASHRYVGNGRWMLYHQNSPYVSAPYTAVPGSYYQNLYAPDGTLRISASGTIIASNFIAPTITINRTASGTVIILDNEVHPYYFNLDPAVFNGIYGSSPELQILLFSPSGNTSYFYTGASIEYVCVSGETNPSTTIPTSSPGDRPYLLIASGMMPSVADESITFVSPSDLPLDSGLTSNFYETHIANNGEEKTAFLHTWDKELNFVDTQEISFSGFIEDGSTPIRTSRYSYEHDPVSSSKQLAFVKYFS